MKENTIIDNIGIQKKITRLDGLSEGANATSTSDFT